MIDRRTADAARLALELMLTEWHLPPERWTEVAELLEELSTAVADGDATALNALTGELDEWSGDRVTRIQGTGDETPSDDDKRVPLPPDQVEQVVALVHALDPDSPPGGPGPASGRRT